VIANEYTKIAGTKISTAETLANYANILDIPKKKTIDSTQKIYAILRFMENNSFGDFNTTDLYIVRDDDGNLKPYYLGGSFIDVIVSSSDSNYYKIYVKATKEWSSISAAVIYNNMTGVLIPKYNAFDTPAANITNKITVKMKRNLADEMTGEADSLTFVTQTTLLNYPYTVIYNAYSGTNQTNSPNPALSASWNVSYEPIFWSGSFSRAYQYWETITGGVYYKYVRTLSSAGVWSAFIPAN
jgi:hypothetical protein